jgi:hypothetical protein
VVVVVVVVVLASSDSEDHHGKKVRQTVYGQTQRRLWLQLRLSAKDPSSS